MALTLPLNIGTSARPSDSSQEVALNHTPSERIPEEGRGKNFTMDEKRAARFGARHNNRFTAWRVPQVVSSQFGSRSLGLSAWHHSSDEKSLMEKLENRLAELRARAETLGTRLAAADAVFLDAKLKLQRHHTTSISSRTSRKGPDG